MRRAGELLLMLTLVAASRANPQSAVRGEVLDAETGAPLQGAQVVARTARRAVTTDRLGHFTLWLKVFPETLLVALIGRAPAVLTLDAAPTEAIRISLETRAVTLSDVIVTAPSDAARPLEDVGRWQVPIAAARGVPPAVETDVFRALTLVSAVSFSTPLSARPLVRGYDADASSIRIDGFEVLNPYHIGRIFAAFPADAASDVSVAAAPQAAATGGTLAGVVDITGQVGEAGRVHGGVDLSLASATGWAGGGGESAQWFGALRAVHLSLLNTVSDARVPYDFQDLYANALLSAAGRPVGRISAFGSRDQLFDRDLGTGMDWSNVLLGGKWRAFEDGRRTVSLWSSANRFAENADDLPARFSRIDLRNRFERLSIGADAIVQGLSVRFDAGFSAGWRSISNRITPRSGDDFNATDVSLHRAEFGLHAGLTGVLARASLQAGARLDAAGATRVLQPRARVAVPLGSAASLGVAVGRTARLYHLVSDPQSEPDFAFYDFWLNAGVDGVPVPRIDHGVIDLDFASGALAGRLSLFASQASGIVELRPGTDQRAEVTEPFRYGRGRSRGLEIQLAVRGGASHASALSASYVLSKADRDWGLSWVPWSQDRRHVVRLAGLTRLGNRWSVSGAFEATSGAPLTPVDGVLLVGSPDSAGDGLRREPQGRPAYIYAGENSARSEGTARIDLSATYSFTGPWRSRATLGLSVVNAGFGPVAPLTPVAPGFEPDPTGNLQGRVRYQRLFDLPAVPTLTLRIEF